MDAPPDRGQPDAPDDAAVIARVLKGDKQAFEHLVSRYQHLLYRHAVAMVRKSNAPFQPRDGQSFADNPGCVRIE